MDGGQLRRAGERVLAGLRKQFEWLRLSINKAESALNRAVRQQFLGLGFWVVAGGRIKRR